MDELAPLSIPLILTRLLLAVAVAAAIWITGAVGMAIGVDLPWLGVVVGLGTALVLFVADITPRVPPPTVVTVEAPQPVSGVKKPD